MSVQFCKRICNEKVEIPSTFVATHWRRLTQNTLKKVEVVFPKNNNQQLDWEKKKTGKDDETRISLIIGKSTLLSLHLMNNDLLTFFYDYPESPDLLRVVSMFDNHGMEMVDTNKGRTYNKYLFQIPTQFQEFVEDIIDVNGDGNCGYRCVARLTGRGENHESVRNDLVNEINSDEKAYRLAFGEDFEKLFKEVKTINGWMDTRVGFITATTFKVPVIQLGLQSSTTYIPQKHKPSEGSSPICYAYVNNNHFVMVTLKEDYRIPTFSGYSLIGYNNDSHLWIAQYKDRILVNDEREYNEPGNTILSDDDPVDGDENSGAPPNEDNVKQQTDVSNNVIAQPQRGKKIEEQIDVSNNVIAQPQRGKKIEKQIDVSDNVIAQPQRGKKIEDTRPCVKTEKKIVVPQPRLQPQRARNAPLRYTDEYMPNCGSSQYKRKKGKKKMTEPVRVKYSCEPSNEDEHSPEISERISVNKNGKVVFAADGKRGKDGCQPSNEVVVAADIECGKDGCKIENSDDDTVSNKNDGDGYGSTYGKHTGTLETGCPSKETIDALIGKTLETESPSKEAIAALIAKVLKVFKIKDKVDNCETSLKTTEVINQGSPKSKGIKIIQILRSV